MHPARYFIRAQILTAPDPTLAGVNAALRVAGLASATKLEYEEAVRDVTAPFVLRLDGTCPKTATWARQKRVYTFLFSPESVQAVYGLLTRAKTRERINRLAVGGASVVDIVKELNDKSLTVLVVNDYIHYFWNRAGMSTTDWETYLAREKAESIRKNAHPIIASLTHGGDVARNYAGVGHRSIDQTMALKKLFAMNMAYAEEVNDMPLSEDKALQLRAVTSNAVRLHSALRDSDEALETTQGLFDRFRARAPGAEPPSLAELASEGSTSVRDERKKK